MRSIPRKLPQEVPQGSLLTPTLFNLALAPHPSLVSSNRRLCVGITIYADNVASWGVQRQRS